MHFPEDKYFHARILERRDIAEDLWIIRVSRDAGFSFKAGQYATLGVVKDGQLRERAYSIVSAPFEETLEFFLELVPQGELTPLLYKRQVGDELTVRKFARGRFALDTASGRTNHFLMATVTGAAPLISIVRSLCRQFERGEFAGEHKLYLLHGASHSGELGYLQELEQRASEHSWFNYIPTISRHWEDPSWQGEVGRVDDLIRKYGDLWGLTPENTTAYLCGHPLMIENGKGILVRRGWAKREIEEEFYFVPARIPIAARI